MLQVVLRCESKLLALLRELEAMREADATAKALIFTQFNTTLEWLKTRLTEEGFGRAARNPKPITRALQPFAAQGA